jgi:hypothetical protein
MLQKPLFAIVLSLIPAVAQAAPDLPKPNPMGDYATRTGHRFWIVVDPDPRGLNCRWSPAMPANWYDPAAILPPANIGQWPIVRRFKKATILTSNTAPAGFALMYDLNNKPWLKVKVGSKEQICLVRANSQFIRPVHRKPTGKTQQIE